MDTPIPHVCMSCSLPQYGIVSNRDNMCFRKVFPGKQPAQVVRSSIEDLVITRRQLVDIEPQIYLGRGQVRMAQQLFDQ